MNYIEGTYKEMWMAIYAIFFADAILDSQHHTFEYISEKYETI